jgi:hypothetical protein
MKKFVGIAIAIVGALIIAWFASHLSFKEVTVPMPLRGEAGRNPFYAAIQLSRTLGAEASWEQMFTEPPRNSVLVLSGWNWTMSRARRERIEKWVEDGGRLVVDSWLLGDTAVFEQWAGISQKEIEFEAGEKAEADTAEEESMEDILEESFDDSFEESCIPLTEDKTRRELEVCGTDVLNSLASTRDIQWALRDGQRIDALRIAVGRGSVTAINGEPFRGRTFMQGDHMKLFLAATQLHRDDTVTFLTEDEHLSLLALVWRFGAPAVLLLLAAVAVALWRAGVRFGPPVAATESARRSLAEQIRGTGQFVLRFGGGRALHAAANRALRDVARQRIHDYERLSSEARVIALAKATGLGVGELSHAMNFSGERNSHELRNAITVLETARRHVLTMKRRGHGN